jgi:hypothetical protein
MQGSSLRRPVPVVNQIGFAGVALMLALGLTWTLAPVSQAYASTGSVRHSAGQANDLAAAPAALLAAASPRAMRTRLLNRERLLADAARGESFLEAGAGAASARTGVISGHLAGRTAGQVCVTAVSTTKTAAAKTAAVGADGNYLLTGLHPGEYALRFFRCQDPVASAWPSLFAVTAPASGLTVVAGLITTARPASVWAPANPVAHRAGPLAPAAARKGSIAGLVTGGKRRLPVSGICAVAYPASFASPVSARTARNGTYLIAGLKPGRYQVEFVADGSKTCPNAGNWLPQWYPQVNSLFPTGKVANVAVKAGAETKGIDAKLSLGGEITGAVRNTSGKPLPGACANVQGNIRLSRTGGSFVDYTLTAQSTGHYAARGLFPGAYQVIFGGCGAKGDYAFQWWQNAASQNKASTIKLAGAGIFTGISATLQPGAKVAGTVRATDAAGIPLAGVCVAAMDNADGYEYGFTTTGKGGGYSISGLAAGEYSLQFNPSCGTNPTDHYLGQQVQVGLATGEQDTGFNVYLTEAAGISGVVTDASGHPLSGVCVLINDNNADLTTTGSNGSYQFIGILPGSYQVQFFGGCGNAGSVAPQFYDNQPASPFATLVPFKAATITAGVNATMQPGGTIDGKVTDASGHPVTDACVSVTPQQGYFPQFYLTGVAAGVTTSLAGHYELANLPISSFDVTFGCGRYAVQWYKSQATTNTATAVSTSPYSTARINARLSQAGAISGTVTNPAGKPLSQVCVLAVPAGQGGTPEVTGTGDTGKNGAYVINGLLAGRYLVQYFSCQGHKYASQWYKNRPTVGSATPVQVRAGQTSKGISAALAAGGSLTGMVTGPSGRPLANACVFAYDSAALVPGLALTSSSGRYTITGLASGRYSIRFTPCRAKGMNLATQTMAGQVRVTAPRTTKVPTFKVVTGGSIAGQVTGGAGGTTPIAGVCVYAAQVNPADSVAVGRTNAAGKYTVSGLAPGSYHVYFGLAACDSFPDQVPPVAPQWYGGKPTEATTAPVTVTAGKQTGGIDAVMGPFGSISGTVTTTKLTPVLGECVTAVPFKTAAPPGPGLPLAPELAVTDHAGSYRLAGLWPGRYQLEFSSGCGGSGFASQWWSGANSAKTAKVITVKYAEITGVNAELHH